MVMEEPERRRRAAIGLNEDFMEEVLLRIPCCKSLLKLRAVCKRWRNVIDDPHFRYLHSLRSAQRPAAALFPLRTRLDVVRFFGDRSRSSFPSPPSFFFASSHGLVCLHTVHASRMALVVCNPIIRESLVLPRPPCDRCLCSYFFNFGFHAPTNKYKVVVMCRGRFHILAVGGASWTTVEASGMHTIPTPFRFCYKGVLHWMIMDHRHDHIDDVPTLLTFDLGTEELRTHVNSNDNNSDVDGIILKIDLDLSHGVGEFHLTRIIMLSDSGKTMDIYLLQFPHDNFDRIWYYRKKWSFKIVEEEEEEEEDHAAVDVGPLCIEIGGTLICDQQGFRSEYHLHILKKKVAEEKDDSTDVLSSLLRPLSLHAETLVSLKNF